MFCSKCGAEIADGTKFCGTCGAPIDQPTPENPTAEVAPAEVAPAEVAPAEETPAEVAPAEVTPAEETPAEVAPAEVAPAEETQTEAVEPKVEILEKPKKKTGVIVGIIAAVVAVAILCGTVFGNQFARIFKSDKDYFKYTNKKDLSYVAKAINTYIHSVKAPTDMGVDGSIELKLTDDGKKELIDMIGIDDSYLDWADSASIGFSENLKDGKLGLSADVSLNNKKIISGTVASDLEQGEVYIDIPKFSKEPLLIEEDILDGLSMDEYSAIDDDVSNILKKAQSTFNEKLIEKYINIVIDSVDDVTKEKETLEIGSVKQKCKKYTATIDSDFLYKASTRLIKELKNDKEIKSFIKDCAKIGDFDVDDFYDELDEAADELDEDMFDGFGEFEYSSWIDGNGEVIARALTSNGYSIYYGVAKKGKNFAFIASAGDEDSMFEKNGTAYFYGEGTYSGDKYTGDCALSVEGEEIVAVRLEKFTAGTLDKGKMSGKIIISAGDDAADLISDVLPSDLREASGIVAMLLRNYKVGFTFDSDAKAGKTSTTVELLNSDKVLASVSFKVDIHDGKKVSVPKDGNDDAEDWAESLDIDGIIDTLDDAGVPSDLLDMISY